MATVVGNWGAGAIWRVTSGAFPSNAYFCATDAAGGGFLIDPGLDGAAIDKALQEHGLTPHQVFCTHGHFDHLGSAAFFQDRYAALVYLHRADLRIMQSSNFMLMAMKLPQRIRLPQVTPLDEGFHMQIAGHLLQYRHAPGHSPGSCIITFGSAWFTGDTLYSHGVGLSRLPGEDHALLKTSLENLWPELTEDRVIYPGHGDAADGLAIRTENTALLRFMGLEYT